MTSVKFPEDFIALIYPGYFWNPLEKRLYSIKVNGVLTPLKINQGRYPSWIRQIGKHYQLSVKGQRKYISLNEIERFLVNGTYEVPVLKEVDIFPIHNKQKY